MTWNGYYGRASAFGRMIGRDRFRQTYETRYSRPLPYGRSLNLTPVPISGNRVIVSLPEARVKRAQDIDTLVSVLEVSATKRDIKGYLQKYTEELTARKADTRNVAETSPLVFSKSTDEKNSHNVAIVKIRTPQSLDKDTIWGIAKTLSQLRTLGLLSIVVVDCGAGESKETFKEQALLIYEAIEWFSRPGAKLLDGVMVTHHSRSPSSAKTISYNLTVEDQGALKKTLDNGLIAVVPSLARDDEAFSAQPVSAHQLVTGLTRYLADSPFGKATERFERRAIASVERIILLEPLGGTPIRGRSGASHRFINLDQEYELLQKEMVGLSMGSPMMTKDEIAEQAVIHSDNLRLVRETLAILPSTSSALITTPYAAANVNSSQVQKAAQNITAESSSTFGLKVKPRMRQNPLLRSLLTDKPVFSSSLPIKQSEEGIAEGTVIDTSYEGTLLKKGMPLTIFPDPRESPWIPLAPGAPRLRLTDACIDLPRLTHLIEDSFGRKLDLQRYLERVNENLAGVIVAGEYEGGAILTWESPEGVDQETAYRQGCLVPYLDKFAVLRSRQGSGGVADIVFNAIVQNCFPGGVCWRSRKNNPVNKWYFERSAGTNKLSGCNWSMFWTTLNLHGQHPTLQDYESACRKIEPSWADKKHILD